MSTLTLDHRTEPDAIEDLDDGEGRMPRRPRRRLLTPWSALLLATMMCAIGFYAGVRVEKGHIAVSPTTIGAGGGFATAGAAGSGAGGTGAAGTGAGETGAAGTGASTAGASGSTPGSGAGAAGASGSAAGASGSAAGAPSAAGFAGRFGGGDGTFGTVASVNGRTLTLTEAGGDTVKVELNSATKVTKSQAVKRSQIHPGDTITVSGVTGKQGTVSAATVTDSGAGTTGAARGSSGSSGSSVSSLFSGG